MVYEGFLFRARLVRGKANSPANVVVVRVLGRRRKSICDRRRGGLAERQLTIKGKKRGMELVFRGNVCGRFFLVSLRSLKTNTQNAVPGRAMHRPVR